MAKTEDTDEPATPDFIDVKLSKPIKVDGVDTRVLRMREHKVKDQLAAQKMQLDAADTEIALVANLCGVPPEALHELTGRDYARVQKAYKSFFG